MPDSADKLTLDAPGSLFDGAETIYAYTVEQAVEDGVLFDARNLDGPHNKTIAGDMFRKQFNGRPVYLTSGLYALVERAVENRSHCNDWAGVCWDIIMVAGRAVRSAVKEAQEHGSGRATFVVIITGCGRVRNRRLDAVIDGNGLTFCLEGED